MECVTFDADKKHWLRRKQWIFGGKSLSHTDKHLIYINYMYICMNKQSKQKRRKENVLRVREKWIFFCSFLFLHINEHLTRFFRFAVMLSFLVAIGSTSLAGVCFHLVIFLCINVLYILFMIIIICMLRIVLWWPRTVIKIMMIITISHRTQKHLPGLKRWWRHRDDDEDDDDENDYCDGWCSQANRHEKRGK